MDVSFNSGLSSISRVADDVVDKDFPKDKSSFKPSGEGITAYFWTALEMGRTFQNREKRFAMSVDSSKLSLSPDEHHMMTNMALAIFEKHKDESPKYQKALDVLKESRELQEMLMMSRNILVAG
ncbi:hypothetical protein GZ77_12955 [Endozoicomonas montiporae]|uniref:Uncharacterized protein n=2 Tax=Endozoicomonas montiporae TaxID=1027273 RepID=A0A081N4F6_9GAMM|nr:hypothetical protein [Endozoicomonas montiporae]AMO57823.1 hypothetical protein EZMO1_3881 [Endozoicomonas montiporae CL-33]KEQ13329.1 hypothetical protein GZ77_12955 [Endozoicomonas montiporae]